MLLLLQEKDSEAAVLSDRQLAHSIMIEQMLATPAYGGAGALLSVTATNPALRSSNDADVDSRRRFASFTVLRPIFPAGISAGAGAAAAAAAAAAPEDDTLPSAVLPGESVLVGDLPAVHMVAYLYARAQHAASSSQEDEIQHRHITTLEFLLLDVDGHTYTMRERQIASFVNAIVYTGAEFVRFTIHARLVTAPSAHSCTLCRH